MAVTAYCKKCGRDVTPGEVCERCGAKLGSTANRVAWCVDHTPVRDWMCWNAVMRMVLPVLLLVFLLVLLLEGFAGGMAGIEALLTGGLLLTMLLLLLAVTVVILLVLILQGDDVVDCVVDNKGVHVRQYLMNPTPFQLMLHLKSPQLLHHMDPEDPMLLISQQDLAWKDMARVQLWSEKTMVLFYSPSWWMRVYLPCTPFTYGDVLGYVKNKIGNRKKIELPTSLQQEKVAGR